MKNLLLWGLCFIPFALQTTANAATQEQHLQVDKVTISCTDEIGKSYPIVFNNQIRHNSKISLPFMAADKRANCSLHLHYQATRQDMAFFKLWDETGRVGIRRAADNSDSHVFPSNHLPEGLTIHFFEDQMDVTIKVDKILKKSSKGSIKLAVTHMKEAKEFMYHAGRLNISMQTVESSSLNPTIHEEIFTTNEGHLAQLKCGSALGNPFEVLNDNQLNQLTIQRPSGDTSDCNVHVWFKIHPSKLEKVKRCFASTPEKGIGFFYKKASNPYYVYKGLSANNDLTLYNGLVHLIAPYDKVFSGTNKVSVKAYAGCTPKQDLMTRYKSKKVRLLIN